MASHIDKSDMEEAAHDEDALIDLDDAGEEIVGDSDHPMDSDGDDQEQNPQEEEDDDDDQEIQLQNDSKSYFDLHSDSIFCIAQHPADPSIIATGSGDETTYIFSVDPPQPLLPPSYESNPSSSRPSLPPLAKLSGHSDSVNAITFTLPNGAYLITGGLDGQLRVHDTTDPTYRLIASAQEVPEINFLTPCPHPDHPNTFALGASDNSVWVYTVDATTTTTTTDAAPPLQVVQAFFLHTGPVTAGAWTPDGKLLATVSEDSSLYVWDVFGEVAGAGVGSAQSQTVVGITAADQRFAVDGGFYSIAVAPSGAFAAVGGAGGMIRVVGLPRLGAAPTTSSATAGKSTKKTKNNINHSSSGSSGSSTAQAGQILASLQAQTDSVETLAFSPAPQTLLAAGSVDSSIAVYDTAHSFAVRRQVRDAHGGHAVVQVGFGREDAGRGHLLTSCGMDGVVRRFDMRGGQGLVREWKGHSGGGGGGGVLGFVLGGGRIVTAGDDGVSLCFEG